MRSLNARPGAVNSFLRKRAWLWGIGLALALGGASAFAEGPKQESLSQEAPTIESAFLPAEGDLRATLLTDILSLRENLLERADEMEKRQSRQLFREMIERNLVLHEEAGVGKARLTLVDGKRVVRVVHEATQLAFVFVDKAQISKDSAHLRRYLARINLTTGANGQLSQPRDAILVWFEDQLPETGTLETEDHRREPPGVLAKIGSREWIQKYFNSWLQKPTRESAVFGLSWAIGQSSLSYGVTMLESALSQNPPHQTFAAQYAPMGLSFLFSSVIGTYVSSYRNWTSTGTQTSQAVKSSLFSLAFSYALVSTVKGIHSINFLDPAGLLQNTSIWLNAVGNNWSKVQWQQLSVMRGKLRMNTGSRGYRDLLTWLGEQVGHPEIGRASTRIKAIDDILDMKFKRSDIEYQSLYLVPFTFKLVDLLNISVATPIGVLPIGRLAFWSTIPIGKYLNYRFAAALTPERVLAGIDFSSLTSEEAALIRKDVQDNLVALKKAYQDEWEDFITLRSTRRAASRVVERAGRVFSKPLDPCAGLFI